MPNLIDFFKSRSFLRTLLIALVVFIIFSLSISTWLGSFTHHGESISVPDLRGQKIGRLESFLSDKKLQYKIVDSLFDLDKSPGVVIEQDPAPDSKVKENRTIYLTINASMPPDVKMPNLIDVSYRQAEAMLQSFGLKVGQLIYKPDLAKNAVLDQLYKGNHIKPLTNLPKGSAIDLVLGDGLGSVDVPVPNLIGNDLGEALFILKGSSLNVGLIHIDPGVRDSTKATIYRQEPTPDENSTLKQGEAVNLYLR